LYLLVSIDDVCVEELVVDCGKEAYIGEAIIEKKYNNII
jgi:hypothetical protein